MCRVRHSQDSGFADRRGAPPAPPACLPACLRACLRNDPGRASARCRNRPVAYRRQGCRPGAVGVLLTGQDEEHRHGGRRRQEDQVDPCDPTHEVHVSEPGLVVVDIAAADDQTAFAFQTVLASVWATTAVERTSRGPGQPGEGCATSTCASNPEPCRVRRDD
ncbi:DUF6207 family protein [Streptomyces sp. NPDC042638]|uniref:DUF6207 family protein n=1 Tax=Streptomyces sp. NPDC042638 TaxID=3154333 RepID=UPI0033D17B9F